MLDNNYGLVNESEACKLFHLNVKTLRRLCREGRLQPGVHYSRLSARKTLYDPGAIKEWIMSSHTDEPGVRLVESY